jgi:hypothetical protein
VKLSFNVSRYDSELINLHNSSSAAGVKGPKESFLVLPLGPTPLPYHTILVIFSDALDIRLLIVANAVFYWLALLIRSSELFFLSSKVASVSLRKLHKSSLPHILL